MSMKTRILISGLLLAGIFAACSKELSYEGPDIPSEGSMQSDITGDCLPKTVNGKYEVGIPLVADSNTIGVTVNVTVPGIYDISTDTINGFFFNAKGRFTTAGANAIKLRSTGTPFAAGVSNFRISFDSTFCDVQVTIN